MNGLPRHETPTATSAVEGAEPRIATRDEEDRGATPGVRWCRRRPGPSRSRREPVATPWPPAPEPAGTIRAPSETCQGDRERSVVVSRPAQMVSGHAQLGGENWASRRMCGIYGIVSTSNAHELRT